MNHQLRNAVRFQLSRDRGGLYELRASADDGDDARSHR
jgi:hypothetical protein